MACLPAPAGVSEAMAPFEMAVSPLSTMSVMSNVAFIAGSSNEGKARRASVGLELRDGVLALRRFAEIEAAQLRR